MNRNSTRVAMVTAFVGGVLSVIPSAQASFHLMAIGEVFAGTPGHTGADYVELTMLANGQDEVDGTRLRFYDADGDLSGTEVLEGDLAGGDAGETILVATTSAGALFGVTPDFTLGTQISGSAGKVCFESPPAGDITTVIDCASWGNFTGSSTGSGTPFRPGYGIASGGSMVRRGSSPNVVDSANSSGDFKLDGPTPRTLSGDTGSVAGGVFRMTPQTLQLTEGDEEQITVSREGDTAETGQVTVRARPNSARPNDFDLEGGPLQFAVDDTVALANLEIVDDNRFERKERFWVFLTDPMDAGQSGSVLGTFAEIRVVVTDDEVDNRPPASAIYRPKDGRSYSAARLRTFKGTVIDGENESGPREVGIALRKKLTNGKCKWLRSNGRFARGGCSSRRYVDAALKGAVEWRFHLDRPLAPSVGTRIKDYKLFSRARDNAGNMETSLEDPNVCRFEISRTGSNG